MRDPLVRVAMASVRNSGLNMEEPRSLGLADVISIQR
jgi:hypothetical protein